MTVLNSLSHDHHQQKSEMNLAQFSRAKVLNRVT